MQMCHSWDNTGCLMSCKNMVNVKIPLQMEESGYTEWDKDYNEL